MSQNLVCIKIPKELNLSLGSNLVVRRELRAQISHVVFPVLHTSSSKDPRLLIKQASAAISQMTCSESTPVLFF